MLSNLDHPSLALGQHPPSPVPLADMHLQVVNSGLERVGADPPLTAVNLWPAIDGRGLEGAGEQGHGRGHRTAAACHAAARLLLPSLLLFRLHPLTLPCALCVPACRACSRSAAASSAPTTRRQWWRRAAGEGALENFRAPAARRIFSRAYGACSARQEARRRAILSSFCTFC